MAIRRLTQDMVGGLPAAIAGGFGQSSSNADILASTGLYAMPNTWTGSPIAGASGHNQGTLFHYQWSNSLYATQEFTNVNVSFMHKRRRKDNGVWGAWYDVFDSKNILGTVSQASGVPTGAIIERGSNANGEFIKWADGTMICTRRYISPTLTQNAGYGTSAYSVLNWTYPAAFSSLAMVNCTARTVNAGRITYSCPVEGILNPSSLCSFFLVDPNTSFISDTYAVSLFAIGRWF